MARPNKNKFIKRQKEFDRLKKAKEKMDRRHGKIEKDKEEAVPTETLDPSDGLEQLQSISVHPEIKNSRMSTNVLLPSWAGRTRKTSHLDQKKEY
jgi:hypothetical protein